MHSISGADRQFEEEQMADEVRVCCVSHITLGSRERCVELRGPDDGQVRWVRVAAFKGRVRYPDLSPEIPGITAVGGRQGVIAVIKMADLPKDHKLWTLFERRKPCDPAEYRPAPAVGQSRNSASFFDRRADSLAAMAYSHSGSSDYTLHAPGG